MRSSNPLDLNALALRYPAVRFVVAHFGAGYFSETFAPRGWNHEIHEARTRALFDLVIGAADARQILETNLSDLLS